MYFVGIISNKIESYIEKKINVNIKNCKIINITTENIENIKNIRFDIILIVENNSILNNNQELLQKLVKNAKYLLINADITINLEFLKDFSLKIITYGFNSKSTITISSVNNENILLCIQRNISNVKNLEIEPQEIIINNNDRVDSLKKIAITAVLMLLKVTGNSCTNNKIYQI